MLISHGWAEEGDKQQPPQLLEEACWGLQIVPRKLPKFTSSFGATSQPRRLFCPRSCDCNAALPYFAIQCFFSLLFDTGNNNKKKKKKVRFEGEQRTLDWLLA